MTTFDRSQRFTQAKNIKLQDIDDSGIVWTKDNRYYGLSRSGRCVWDALAHPSTASDLETKLAKKFSVEPSTVQGQLLSFLGELQDNGLIVPSLEAAGDVQHTEISVAASNSVKWDTPVLMPLDLSSAAGAMGFGDEPTFGSFDNDGDMAS